MSTDDDPAVAAHDACEPEQDVCPTCGRSTVPDAKENQHPPNRSTLTWFGQIVVNALWLMLVIFGSMAFAKCTGYRLNIEVPAPDSVQPEPTAQPAPEPAHTTCLPMSRKLLGRHFDQVHPEDYIQKGKPDTNKPYVGCDPGALKQSRVDKNHYDVWECQICIPPGAVLDLPP